METKQTAVNWLVEKLNQCEPLYSGVQSLEHKQYLDQLVEQAKQMEKEQIIKAYTNGSPEFFDMAEEYYNETYGK